MYAFVWLSKALEKKKSDSVYVSEKSADTHRDVSEGCAHHEVENPGLQLEDVRWRENHPSGGQDKEENGRKEGQEGFVQAAVFQSVTAMSPAKLQRVTGSEHWVKQHCCNFNNTHIKS